ncbi:MAG: cell division protein SepF [Syntrophomonadaceae bacterium]|nr:cell division protein SepF [Syntrophomonadaceae bacterium]
MGVIDSLWKWLGVESEVEEDYKELAKTQEREPKAGVNVVSLHTSGKGMKIVVCEPERFEEVQALADHLKNRKQVILNFEATRPEISQKIIDFISGAVYALDGQSQQLGQNIFLFAPASVEISNDHRTLMRKHEFHSEPFGGKR